MKTNILNKVEIQISRLKTSVPALPTSMKYCQDFTLDVIYPGCLGKVDTSEPHRYLFDAIYLHSPSMPRSIALTIPSLTAKVQSLPVGSDSVPFGSLYSIRRPLWT